jgi:hypothetical protein
MAVIKNLRTKSLIVEMESGVDKNGKTTFRKKTFSYIKLDATDESIYAVANAISKILAPETNEYLLDELSVLSKSE